MKLSTDKLTQEDLSTLESIIGGLDAMNEKGIVEISDEQMQQFFEQIYKPDSKVRDSYQQTVLLKTFSYTLKLYRRLGQIEDKDLRMVGQAVFLNIIVSLFAIDPTMSRRFIALLSNV